jgi:hypothetical protein
LYNTSATDSFLLSAKSSLAITSLPTHQCDAPDIRSIARARSGACLTPDSSVPATAGNIPSWASCGTNYPVERTRSPLAAASGPHPAGVAPPTPTSRHVPGSRSHARGAGRSPPFDRDASGDDGSPDISSNRIRGPDPGRVRLRSRRSALLTAGVSFVGTMVHTSVGELLPHPSRNEPQIGLPPRSRMAYADGSADTARSHRLIPAP